MIEPEYPIVKPDPAICLSILGIITRLTGENTTESKQYANAVSNDCIASGTIRGNGMSRVILDAERAHLSSLLEAIQRCIFFPERIEEKGFMAAASFISYYEQTLAIDPETRDFEKGFLAIIQNELPVQ